MLSHAVYCLPQYASAAPDVQYVCSVRRGIGRSDLGLASRPRLRLLLLLALRTGCPLNYGLLVPRPASILQITAPADRRSYPFYINIASVTAASCVIVLLTIITRTLPTRRY